MVGTIEQSPGGRFQSDRNLVPRRGYTALRATEWGRTSKGVERSLSMRMAIKLFSKSQQGEELVTS